jgi:tetratricopeptide (TPR) repeat protein
MTKPTDPEIAAQRDLLETYRRRLAFNIAQRAKLGTLAPFSLDEEIHEARAEIRRIKQLLHDWGQPVDDQPGDQATLDQALRPNRRWRWGSHRLGSWIVSIAGLLAIGAIVLLAIANAPRPGAPAAQPTASAPTAPATLAPAATTHTTDPPTSQPLPIALTTSNCAEGQSFDTYIDGPLSQRSADELAQMHILASCSADAVTITVRLPQPADPVELLGEPELLTVTTELAYAHTFIQAAIAYASGQYTQAGTLLELDKDFVDSGDAHLLRALALAHDDQWTRARGAYDMALAQWPPEAQAQRATALAGRSLAYVMEARAKPDDATTRDTCLLHATSGYTEAIGLEPDRGLWWAGRAVARRHCPPPGQYDQAAIRQDAEQGLDRSPPSRPLERAYALVTLSQVLFFVENNPDVSRATQLANEASKLAPGLPTPYVLLSCSALIQEDQVAAQQYYQQFRERYKGGQMELPAQVDLEFCGRY